jgi:hypothetical protein
MSTIGPTFADELYNSGLTGLPFSWDANGLVDTSQLTPEQFDAVNAVLAVHDPNLPAIPQQISERQFHQGLATYQPATGTRAPPGGGGAVVTEQEAIDAVSIGAIPLPMQEFIDSLPADQQFAAKMMFAGGIPVGRHESLMKQFAEFMGWTIQQVDEFFRYAATL